MKCTNCETEHTKLVYDLCKLCRKNKASLDEAQSWYSHRDMHSNGKIKTHNGGEDEWE